MDKIFAPGCALMLYKPELAERIHDFLKKNMGDMGQLSTCCRHEPQLITKTEIINVCPGCDKRFRNDYDNTATISLWEILAQNDGFPFPDYKGKKMTIMDACPARDRSHIHDAIRTVLKKMNIVIVEAKKVRTQSLCCGDSFYGKIPIEQVKEQMIKHTAEMPLIEIAVYCVSCVKSVFIGGRNPHYLVDLLFGEETVPKTLEPDQWHRELDDYIDRH